MEGATPFLVAGGMSLVLCLVLVCFYKTAKQQIDEMWAVDTYDARELARMVKGGFDATVEVQGDVSCDSPLTSLAAGVPCCWFHTTVQREERKTRTVTETDSRGRRRTRTETYYVWQTVFDKTYATVMKVHDSTGWTLVDPTNADIDAEKVYDEIVHGREPWFDESVGYSDTGKYKIHEEAFLPSGFAYVLGRASERDGLPLIHYPEVGYLDPRKRFFIVSRKTEQELTRSKQITATVCFWAAIAALLIAGFCAACVTGVIRCT